jgi:hypothetical protein
MKRYILPVVQALVTFGLLWWIFRDPKKNDLMLGALREANVLWLVPGLIGVGIAILLQTQRWVMLLAVQDIRMGFWRAWRLVMIGAFFNLFLLGATGGDVAKIFYAMRETATRKSAAFLSVLVDRIIGLLALIVVTAVICAISFRELMAHPVTVTLMGSLTVILGGSLGLVVAGFLVDRLQLAHKLPTWLPLHAKIVEMASAFSVYARDGRTLAATFAISLPAHLLIFSSFYFAARAFTDQLSLMNVYTVMPVINTITALPISLSGVGVREQLFQQMFGTLFGTPENIAVLVSLAGFFLTIFWGLLGGLVYMVYRPTGVHIRDMEQQVEALERDIEKEA